MPDIALHIKRARGPTQAIKEHLLVTGSDHAYPGPAGTVAFTLEGAKCIRGVKLGVFYAVTGKIYA